MWLSIVNCSNGWTATPLLLQIQLLEMKHQQKYSLENDVHLRVGAPTTTHLLCHPPNY